MRHRSAKLLVWVTPSELAEIERRAAPGTVADWVRATLLGDRVEAPGRRGPAPRVLTRPPGGGVIVGDRED